jgi:hypothetical protein
MTREEAHDGSSRRPGPLPRSWPTDSHAYTDLDRRRIRTSVPLEPLSTSTEPMSASITETPIPRPAARRAALLRHVLAHGSHRPLAAHSRELPRDIQEQFAVEVTDRIFIRGELDVSPSDSGEDGTSSCGIGFRAIGVNRSLPRALPGVFGIPT